MTETPAARPPVPPFDLASAHPRSQSAPSAPDAPSGSITVFSTPNTDRHTLAARTPYSDLVEPDIEGPLIFRTASPLGFMSRK